MWMSPRLTRPLGAPLPISSLPQAVAPNRTAPAKPVPPALRKSRRLKTFLSTATPFLSILLTAHSIKCSLLIKPVVQFASSNKSPSSERRRSELLHRFGIDHVDLKLEYSPPRYRICPGKPSICTTQRRCKVL